MKEATLKQAKKILSLFSDTPAKQLQEILASGFFTDIRDGNIVEVNRNDFREMLDLPPLMPPLLKFLGTVSIPATTEPFVVKDKFRLEQDGGICSYLGKNFKSWFLAKTEDPMSSAVLRYHQLRRASKDGPIIAKLGGEDKSETTLGAIFALMEKQANGKAGDLVIFSATNIFYNRDAAGVLRTVRVRWDGGGWAASAYSVEDPDGWGVGRQVFSRNS